MDGDRRIIRASDADREQAAATLREHFAAGRLTTEEFNQRLDKAYGARTLGEIDELMTDLPGADLAQLAGSSPAVTTGRPRSRRAGSVAEPARGGLAPRWRAAWGAWLILGFVCCAIWLVGASGGTWFLWMVLLVGALMLARRITGAPARGERWHGHPRRSHGRWNGDWPARP